MHEGLDLTPDRRTGHCTESKYTDLNLHQAKVEIDRLRRHSSLLSRITAGLNSSQDFEINLSRVSELLVPALGDWCIIELLNTNGDPKRVHISYKDQNSKPIADRLKGKFGKPNERSLRDKALRSKQSILTSHSTEKNLIPEFEPELPVKFSLTAPIILRNQVLGLLTLIISDSDRQYDNADINFVNEVAYQFAVVIENSRLYDEMKSAVAARDFFFSMVSHELRNPLTSLTIQNSILMEVAEKESPRSEFAGLVVRLLRSTAGSLSILNQLVGDFHDVSSMSSGQFSIHCTKTDLSDLIQKLISRNSDQIAVNGREILFKNNAQCHISCDPLRIEQALGNIVSNAVKYASGSSIIISLNVIEEWAEIRIQDNGPGISEDNQAKLFRCFERGDACKSQIKGLGLGLYIVGQIVRAHQGTIHIESELGSGATFVLRLPKMAK